MSALKLLNLLVTSCLVTFLCSFGATPATALSIEGQHIARHLARSHDAIFNKKRVYRRGDSARCKPRPTSHAVQHTTSAKPPAHTGSSSGGNSSGGGSSGGGSSGGGNTPPPTPFHGGAHKFGLAWPSGESPRRFTGGKSSAIYTWSPWYPGDARSLGLRPFPMLWGEKQVGDFSRLVKPGYADVALGFNEPNQRGQADMSPQRGAQLWRQYLQPLAHQGYQLGSPATTSAPSGMVWMKDFFSACGGCTVNFITIHYYDVSAQGFIDYVTNFHNTFNRPVVPTEYACQNFNGGAQCTRDETWGFHQRIKGWMDSTSWIPYYFPFGAFRDMQGVNVFNQLMNPDGSPTPLGWSYIN